jgi:hypothetical protein
LCAAALFTSEQHDGKEIRPSGRSYLGNKFDSLWHCGGQGLGKGDLEQVTSLACLAAYHGQDACLRIFQHFKLRFTGSICLHAADAGQLPCLRLAHQLGDYLMTHSARQAAAQGRRLTMIVLINVASPTRESAQWPLCNLLGDGNHL